MKGEGENGILRIPLLGVGSFCNPAGFLRSFLVHSISENILYPCLSLIKFFFYKSNTMTYLVSVVFILI